MENTEYINSLFVINNGKIGIRNAGCSCYLNSILQCFSRTIDFAKIFVSNDKDDNNSWSNNINPNHDDGDFVREFNTLVKVLWNTSVDVNERTRLIHINTPEETKYTSISVNRINLLLKKKYPYLFEPPFQQDSSEVLIYLLECLHNGMSRQINIDYDENMPNKLLLESIKSYKKHFEKDYSILVDLFYGTSISTIKVDGTDIQSNMFDMFSMYPLIIPDTNLKTGKRFKQCSLYDCFDESQSSERLCDNNKWYHEETDQKYNASKQIHIFKPPKILVLHLKRYGYLKNTDANGKVTYDYNKPTKNITIVNFPFELDIKNHVYDLECLDNENETKYNLYATSNHMGVPQGGHFFANCKVGDQWLCYDDDNVTEIKDPKEIVNNRALVLFYRQI
jgi:ubiquitin C-terminal hydrolase